MSLVFKNYFLKLHICRLNSVRLSSSQKYKDAGRNGVNKQNRHMHTKHSGKDNTTNG